MNRPTATGVLLILLAASGAVAESAGVTLVRVPDGGLQPQVALDGKGVAHLVYYKGDAKAGDLFYVRSDDGGAKWSAAIRVNSGAGSAVAAGNVRGAHVAVGGNGRVHVAWMGSMKAEPKGPDKAMPMLYARLDDQGRAFEPQRNLITSAVGLDGGGSVAADAAGNVWVAWHADGPRGGGEAARRVWVAHSADEGKTFAAETPADVQPTGACGCCGMRTFADGQGRVYMLYRSAEAAVNRDMHLLFSKDAGKTFTGAGIQKWRVSQCVMSTAGFAESPAGGVLAAWETEKQIWFGRIDPASGRMGTPVAAPGAPDGRKHPAVAADAAGDTILVWTEGMVFGKGGAVAWQVFDKAGKPTAVRGRADGVPTWSLVAVFARPGGGFVVLY